jgi:predicted negative regulator of RcsB-dependent stress response
MRTEGRHDEGLEAASIQFLDYIQTNGRNLAIGAGILLLLVLGYFGMKVTQGGSNAAAASQLALAMRDVQANQLDPAAQKLNDLISHYGGSASGNRARLVLGNVELRRGNAAAAQKQFDDYLSHAGSDFLKTGGVRGRAVALENQAKYADAAHAYEALAKESIGDEEQARTLLDAARSRTLAGDSAGATADYDRILKEFSQTRSAAAAKQRKAELAASTH